MQAVLNLVRNPSLSPAGLFALARTASVYLPALTAPLTAWILALLYTDTDLYASGRIAIDAKGNICARQTATPLAAGTPASSAPPTVAAASASQPGGTPAWGWAAITAAFAVLAAGAVLFFRRRYARS